MASSPSTTTMSSPHVLFGEMPTPPPTVEDPFYNQFMENVIYEGRGETFQMGGHGDAFDPEEAQSQDDCSQYITDEDFEADDHGDSWHEDDDIYCEDFARHDVSKGSEGEKKRQGKEQQMKQYMELQTKKFEMEDAAKKRKIDMEEAPRQRQLDIEATNAATKAKEVAQAIMSVDLSKMREKTRSWFEARQKEMFDADDLN
ncbi:hypothetical protein VPH35_026899 [Triticum aestivum]